MAGAAGVLRVLQVEDNASNQRLVERLLVRRPGTELVSAATIVQGRELVRTLAVDVVLLDLHLPDGSGEELLVELAADPAAPPVVVLSSDALPATASRVLAAGARLVLTKPLDVARLYAVLDEVAAGTA